jgi:hypothetical protein
MFFPFLKNASSQAAEIAALKEQLENARRRITELALETIQQAHEIATLQEYRGVPVPEAARPILAIGKEMPAPRLPANTEIGSLFSIAG